MPDQMPDSSRADLPQPDSPQPDSGRERLAAALRSPTRGQITVAVLLGLLGFAAVVQVRANDEDDSYRGASQQDLIQLINTQDLAIERVQRQIASLRADRDSLLSNTEANKTALGVAQRQADSLGILAGTSRRSAPG